MSGRLSRRTETFIVRLWAEYLEQTPPSWRGEIKRVGSGEVKRFGNVDEMLEFIEGLAVKPRREKQGGRMHKKA